MVVYKLLGRNFDSIKGSKSYIISNAFHHDFMGFKTTIAKASTIANSFRTTVPSGIINQFNLKEGDKLDWTLKAENGEIIIIVKPDTNVK